MNKNSEIEKLSKRIRKAQIIGAYLGVALVIILALLGVKPWTAFLVVFIPILIIIFLLGHQLGKKLGIPEFQLKPILPKKEVFILLFLFIIGVGIHVVFPQFSWLFFLFVVLQIVLSPYFFKKK